MSTTFILGPLLYLAMLALVALALYWVIRLAVRHALADAARAGHPAPAAPPAPTAHPLP
ncbi:hypothetical protein [Cellulomonas soli]